MGLWLTAKATRGYQKLLEDKGVYEASAGMGSTFFSGLVRYWPLGCWRSETREPCDRTCATKVQQ